MTQIKARVTALMGLILDLEPKDKSKPNGNAVINVIKKIKKVNSSPSNKGKTTMLIKRMLCFFYLIIQHPREP